MSNNLRDLLQFTKTIHLQHDGDCRIVGVTPDGRLFVEELYGEDDWLAHSAYSAAGELIALADEQFGAQPFTPLALPDMLFTPTAPRAALHLNYAGARERGLREHERVQDLVQPLSVAEKMLVVDVLKLGIAPPMLLGIAESTVLAEAVLTDDTLLVCRRLRFAYALPTAQQDAGGQFYDYSSAVVHTACVYSMSSEVPPPLEAVLRGIGGLHRPLDCVCYDGHIFVADGGAAGRYSSVQVFQLQGAV